MDKKIDKKTIIIIAVIVVAAVAGAVIGIVSVKSKKGNEETTTSAPATTETTTAGPITATFTEDGFVLYDDAVWEQIKMYPDRWGNAFTASYGMSDEDKASCLEGPETGEWVCYQMEVIIDNSQNDNAVSYTGFKIENNGEDGIYIQQNISSTFETVEAHGTNSVILNIFVHNADATLDDVRSAVSMTSIQLICGPEITEFPDDDSALIPEDKTVYVDVVAE